MKVKCISDYEKLLTVGREYNVLGFPNDNEIRVKNDRDTVVNLPRALFDTSTLKEAEKPILDIPENEEVCVETTSTKNVYKEPEIEIEVELDETNTSEDNQEQPVDIVGDL